MKPTVRLLLGVVVCGLAVTLVVGTIIAGRDRGGETTDSAEPTTASGSVPSPSAQSETPRIAFIGDQISSGSGAGPRMGYAYGVARSMCFVAANLSFPDSGYVQPGRPGGTFGDRVTDILAGRPRYVVLQGSVSDDERSSDTVRRAAGDVLARLTRRLPRTSVFVIVPFAAPGSPEPSTANSIRRAARAAGVTVVDPGRGRWLSADEFISPGDYIAQSGHDTLARRMVTELRRAGVPRGPGCSDGSPIPSR